MVPAVMVTPPSHMRMQQLARATALSANATTRLVNRLERALAEAQEVPELAPLVDALPRLHPHA